MANVRFVIVVSTVSDGVGNSVAGPVASIPAGYLAALRARVAKYWLDTSGGRVQVDWEPDQTLVLTQTFDQWKALDVGGKLKSAWEQANIGDGINVILVANDDTPGEAATPHGYPPYVHATWLQPAVVTHEMGHFFQWFGTGVTGHADVARTFFRDEYDDPTCIMGGEGNKYTFRDSLIPALPSDPSSTRSGPLMNPAMVDQCGWLDPGSPQVRVLDRDVLGSAVLRTWTGAPPEDGVGMPTVAIVDGVGPEESRLYVCVRQATGWDRGFAKAGVISPLFPQGPARWLCAYLATSSGDSLLLAREQVVEGSSASLKLVPIRIRIGSTTPEGTNLEFFRDGWRGSAPIEGVECEPKAQVAVAAWGTTADMYVIDREGFVRYNHYNGDGWEHRPWGLIDGVRCDPLGGIACVARTEGLVDVFVTDTDGTVQRRQRHHRTWSPAWNPIDGGGLDERSSLAACRLDERTIMLCGVRPGDGVVSRTLVDEFGAAGNWESAPPFTMQRVAATPAEDLGGRIYATAANNPDRTIWDTPDVDTRNPAGWDFVGTLSFGARRPITASRMVGADDFVVAGTAPPTVLFWTGTEWLFEQLPELDRQPEGGLSCFSLQEESFHCAWVDSDGGVNVFAWSPRQDFAPATNQYQTESTVVFQAATGHFVQANSGGGDGMSANSGNLGAWEKLRMLECGTYVINAGAKRRVVAFQTDDGHYVGATGGGGSHLVATASQVGPWERFYLHELGYSRVTVGCINESHFWSAVGGGGAAMAADKADEKEWESFTMVAVAP